MELEQSLRWCSVAREVVLLRDQLGKGTEIVRESVFPKKQCSERNAGFLVKRTLKNREDLQAGKCRHFLLCKWWLV